MRMTGRFVKLAFLWANHTLLEAEDRRLGVFTGFEGWNTSGYARDFRIPNRSVLAGGDYRISKYLQVDVAGTDSTGEQIA